MERQHHDVVILGAGLAGLSLARHLLLETDKTVLLLERRDQVPPQRQKVGESTVQVAGNYFSRVLDLEEYLLRNHFMKYNLRFYWKTPGRDNDRFEDYRQSYIRPFSNVASYQLDRNTFEAELFRRNLESPRCHFVGGVSELDPELAEAGAGPHTVRFDAGGERRTVTADWVVDTTGRRRLIARRDELRRPNPIRHGAFFWWVDGLVDVERLTDRSRAEIRRQRYRRRAGHLPIWLATNHFMGEGLWFWVIPLQGKTSLGLVFDRSRVDHREVFTVEKATEWVCRELPLFARDLPHREVLDFGGLKDFSYDCAQTLDPRGWAMAGEAGRFTDPLYSPGSDLIAIYNTLIVDAIETDPERPDELASKCARHEQLMRAVYQAYVPSYSVSYDALGDQEVFSLKYGWELAIYFGFYVFPFLNDLFTDRRFALGFLRAFSQLGPINRGVQRLLSGYFQWKKERRAEGEAAGEPTCFDFTEIAALARAEKTFYEVDVEAPEAMRVLAQQLDNLRELARFLAARVASVVLDDPRVLTHRGFVEGIDLEDLRFDPGAMAERWRACRDDCRDDEEFYEWSFDPSFLRIFDADDGRRRPEEPAEGAAEPRPAALEVAS